MRTRPSSRQVLTEFRRGEILDAALELFGKKGFAQTRMDDIAKSADLAKGTLYLYFSSKDEIYEAAVKRAVTQQNIQAADAMGSAQDTTARLRSFLSVRMSFWTSHPDLYRLLATLGRERQFRKQTNAIIQRSTSELVEIFAKGVQSGELAERDYAPAAWALLDMMRGMNERRMYGESTSSIKQDTADILRMLLPFVGLPGEPDIPDSISSIV
jgi:AcrR family transcriptional regulator